MDKEKVTIRGLSVEINYDKTGKWKRDRLLFSSSESCFISEEAIQIAIEYLYQEGFIVDRRIKYEII